MRSPIFKFLLGKKVMNHAEFSAVFSDILTLSLCNWQEPIEGHWNDIGIAESLVRWLDSDQAIHDMKHAQRLACIFAQLLRFGKLEYMEKFLRIKADDEMLARGVEAILQVADHFNRKVLTEYQPVFNDDADSNTFKMFVFENALLGKLALLTKN
jgi:hypothetical protein